MRHIQLATLIALASTFVGCSLIRDVDVDPPANASADMDMSSADSGADMTMPPDMSDDAMDMERADMRREDMARDMSSPSGCQDGKGGNALVVARDGDDSNAGTLAEPFATLGRALSAAQPGVTIYLRGGIYDAPAIFSKDGTQNNPITLTRYCNEDAVIDGRNLSSPDNEPALVDLRGRSYVSVKKLILRGLSAKPGNFAMGIRVGNGAHDIVIEDNLIESIRAASGGLEHGANGIGIYGDTTTPVERIVVRGNELRDLSLGWSEALVVNGNVRDFLIEDNHIHDVDNIAIDAIGFEEICESCSTADTAESLDDVDRARDGIIRKNRIHDVTSSANANYGGDKSAGCIYIDGGQRIIVEQNDISRCDLGIELGSENPGKSTRQIIVRNNLLYHNDVSGIITGGYSEDSNKAGGGTTRDCKVVHNTIYDSSRDGWADTGLLLQNRNISNVYANNLIVATPGHSSMATYHENSFGDQLRDANIVTANLTVGYRDNIPVGPMGQEVTSAGMIDPMAEKFGLLINSPATHMAASYPSEVVGMEDFAGEPRVKGMGPDIGAYESF